MTNYYRPPEQMARERRKALRLRTVSVGVGIAIALLGLGWTVARHTGWMRPAPRTSSVVTRAAALLPYTRATDRGALRVSA